MHGMWVDKYNESYGLQQRGFVRKTKWIPVLALADPRRERNTRPINNPGAPADCHHNIDWQLL